MKSINGQHLKIIAKVETQDTIDNIEDIIKATDGININRTKLAIIVGKDKVDAVKKDIISMCNRYGKPVLLHTGLDIKAKNDKA